MIKEKRTDKQYLLDMCDAIKSANEFLGKASQKDFEGDYMLQSAVFRQFEIIREAASRLSADLTRQHDKINWQEVIGMRHKMIHDYFEVSVDIVWNTAKNDLPVLKEQIEDILKNF